MSKLLLNEQPLLIMPKFAAKVGLNVAIWMQQLNYWISDKRCQNEREGRKWHYDTLDAWLEQFPFFSKSTLQRTIEKSVELGLVDRKQFNKLKGDPTMWYTINYTKMAEIETEIFGITPVVKMTTTDVQNENDPVVKMTTDIYKEQRLRSETTTENNNTATAKIVDPVVVNELFENAEKQIPKRTLTKFLNEYPLQLIQEKLLMLKTSKGVKKPAAWLRQALKENWQASANESSKPKETPKVTNHEVEAKKRNNAFKQAMAALEARGVVDPRLTGKPVSIDVIREYDAILTAEINFILQPKKQAGN